MAEMILLPGIGGSDEAHWQSRWQERNPSMRRFRPSDWDRPDLEDWMAALDREVAASSEPPVLIAHSLACLLVAHWAKRSAARIAGAFLVSVPDPSSDAFPSAAATFAEPPEEAFCFPSLIVASIDDPYGTLDHAKGRARTWGGGLVLVGARGHINETSGLGDWPEGMALLHAFAAGARRPCEQRTA
jgi:uncharacterized protein